MNVSLIVQRIVAFGANPWTILASVLLGCILGRHFPAEAERSSIVGKIYLDLLQMVMLPFLLSSVTMGLARILRERKLAALRPMIRKSGFGRRFIWTHTVSVSRSSRRMEGDRISPPSLPGAACRRRFRARGWRVPILRA